MPSIVKRFDLCRGLGSVLLPKQDVVGSLAVEGWIQVDQVNRLILDVAPQDVQVIAVVECILCDLSPRLL